MARRPLDEVNHEATETAYRRLLIGLRPLLLTFTRQDWRGRDKVPQTGGVIIVSNHISHFDPIALGHYLVWAGRWPRYLGKASLFTTPVIGWFARACGQIPVERNSARASDALTKARAALADGKAVTIYPEGTVTDDPELWPMAPRTGAARLALTTSAHVVPVGQWGAHEVMRHRKNWPHLLPPKTMRFLAGDPVPLDDLRGPNPTRKQVAEAGVRIMDALTSLVAQLRNAEPPAERYDMRAGRRMPWPPGRDDGSR